jgi:hypothetical protein
MNDGGNDEAIHAPAHVFKSTNNAFRNNSGFRILVSDCISMYRDVLYRDIARAIEIGRVVEIEVAREMEIER